MAVCSGSTIPAFKRHVTLLLLLSTSYKLPCFSILYVCFYFSTRGDFLIGLWASKLGSK
jgi:hypothetical protein